ncbi:hypothetical protein PL11201_70012 [Planktothrix sp. PCC 11201]|uniref:DUF4347 domain-containing protein n=1 Tax=Planktothrix sp. PCC 11201 TaxID=1729650 RepID=UPI0009233E16|nr:DUF4347 domain-containing protein [Planktothrix sp. PCC 11201]SKB15165.1 hypothetical protein PL11201_70012 [Planktothrix sp. PCC 11201]
MEMWHSPDNSEFSGIPAAASSTTAYLGRTGQDHFNTLGQTSQSSNIAFIDSNIHDYQDLVKGLQPNTDIWVLDSLQDEVIQITQVLSSLSDIKSLSIFSHGSDGHLQLGTTDLNLNNLGNYADALTNWRGALTEDADILLYGCNVAASQAGQDFVQQIDQLTGADVGASKDLTGSASVGGNWNLEFLTGAIETSNILPSWVQEGYDHTLATFSVTNNGDSGAGSLRQAILDANAAAGADTINFTGTMADTTPDTITLTSGQLLISGDVTINGPGANLLTISGNNAGRVFVIYSVNATIGGVTIANGKADIGGGIYNYLGSLGLFNSTLNDNVATVQGGGIFNYGNMLVNGGTFNRNIANNTTSAANGGGIFNYFGSLEARNSTFNTNQAKTYGGGICNNTNASLTVDNDIFSKNTALNRGGGICNYVGASMTVTTSVIKDGTASILGGGICNYGTMVSLDNTLIQSNKATSSGGAGGGVFNAGTANITNTTILSNSTAGQGGGIYNGTASGNLTLRNNSLLSGNSAAKGGGIYNATGATAKVGGSNMISNRLTSSSGVGPDAWGNYTSEGFNTLYRTAGSTGFSAANGDTIIFG